MRARKLKSGQKWTRMKKSKLFVVDTSYLLAKNALPKHSPIILPYQVSHELHFLKRRMCNRVENVEKKLNYNSNIIFQNAETRFCPCWMQKDFCE